MAHLDIEPAIVVGLCSVKQMQGLCGFAFARCTDAPMHYV